MSVLNPNENREFKRVDVTLPGRFMRQNRTEYVCTISAMSPGDATFRSQIICAPGEKIIAYMDHVGRIEGTVSRVDNGGFGVVFSASERKREKLASQLTWLINRTELGLAEDRRHERLAPRRNQTVLEMSNGHHYPCSILDMSFSGMAVGLDHRPEMGSRVIIGSIRGQVVRHFEEGVAIEFASLQSKESLQAAFPMMAAA